jgi:hypothetical protein
MLDGNEVRRRKSGKDMGDCENMVGIVMSVIAVTLVFSQRMKTTMEGRGRDERSGRLNRLRSHLLLIVFESVHPCKCGLSLISGGVGGPRSAFYHWLCDSRVAVQDATSWFRRPQQCPHAPFW